MAARFTVTQLAENLRWMLADLYREVWVDGEIGRFSVHSTSGHWYFTLVEGAEALDCSMWASNNQRLRWTPRQGERVAVGGDLELYQGKLRLNARYLIPSGEGARARALEELKARLAAQGLFAEERKRPLPLLPRAVGVATSASGAAWQDIRTVLERRFPGIPIILAHCRVQGEGAAESVATALARLAEDGRPDVIIVGRGGGSQEDLWAFNEEALVRAVAACPVPVISAVGHETDFSLCDLAADRRAPTPSAAAELAVPEKALLARHLAQLRQRLDRGLRRDLDRRRHALARLRPLHPGERLKLHRRHLEELRARMQSAATRQHERGQARLGRAAGRLDALSPLRVLQRGYAIASHEDGRAVRDAAELQPGEVLDLRFASGRARARVEP